MFVEGERVRRSFDKVATTAGEFPQCTVHTCMQTHTHMHIRMHMHTHAHTCTPVRKHTHTCTDACTLLLVSHTLPHYVRMSFCPTLLSYPSVLPFCPALLSCPSVLPFCPALLSCPSVLPADCVMFDEFASHRSQAFHSAILIDLVHYPFISREDLLRDLKNHVLCNIIKVR